MFELVVGFWRNKMKMIKVSHVFVGLAILFLMACSDNRQAGPSSEVPVIGQIVFDDLGSKDSSQTLVVVEITAANLNRKSIQVDPGLTSYEVELDKGKSYRVRLENTQGVVSHSKTINVADSDTNELIEIDLPVKKYAEYKIQFNEELPDTLYSPNTLPATKDENGAWTVLLDKKDTTLFTLNEKLKLWKMEQKTQSLELSSQEKSLKLYNLGVKSGSLCGTVEMGANEICDTRENRIYRTTQIGNNIWLGEDLKFQTGLSFSVDGRADTNAETDSFYCLDGKSSNCEELGVQYGISLLLKDGAWKEFCPNGWRQASFDDWDELLGVLGAAVGRDSLKKSNVISLPKNKMNQLLMKRYQGQDSYEFGATLPISEVKIESEVVTRFYPIPAVEKAEMSIEISNNDQSFISQRALNGFFPIRCVRK